MGQAGPESQVGPKLRDTFSSLRLRYEGIFEDHVSSALRCWEEWKESPRTRDLRVKIHPPETVRTKSESQMGDS